MTIFLARIFDAIIINKFINLTDEDYMELGYFINKIKSTSLQKCKKCWIKIIMHVFYFMSFQP